VVPEPDTTALSDPGFVSMRPRSREIPMPTALRSASLRVQHFCTAVCRSIPGARAFTGTWALNCPARVAIR
jgi:hypothetical protein